MKTLEEKVALVTGAAVRVGREIALTLARAGCDIAVHYRESEIEAQELADEIRDLGRQAWLVQGDLANLGAVEAVMREAWNSATWIDILVNNAACYTRDPFEAAEAEDYETAMRVNAFAPILLARAMSRLADESQILPEAYRGQIINILDRDIVRNGTGSLPYWLSKKALESATLGLASELAPRFAVNAVAPGPVLASDDLALREPAGAIPLATRPLPSDVAECVLFLAQSSAITGQILFADGGQHLGN